MAKDLLASLKAIDFAILTDVVQQDQNSSTFEITDWSARRLSEKRLMNPDGLRVLVGMGFD